MSADPDERRPAGARSELVVLNLQRRHALPGRSRSLASLRSFLARVASETGASAKSATLALVSDERMRELNREHRGFDKATDVLSFAWNGNGRRAAGSGYLGDIVISVDTAFRQARRRGTTLRRELRVLTLHGFLHLLGYDHETDGGEMRRIEYRLRRKFGITQARRASVES
jgi:probable rRNA maturation factor